VSYSTPSSNKNQGPKGKKSKNLTAITIPLAYIANRRRLKITLLDVLFYGFLYSVGIVRLGTDETIHDRQFAMWKLEHTIETFAKTFAVHRKSVVRCLRRLKVAGLVGFEAKIPRQELFLKLEDKLLASIVIDAKKRKESPGALNISEAILLSFISFRSNGKLQKCTQTYREIGKMLGMKRHTVYKISTVLHKLNYVIKEAVTKMARSGNTYICAMYHKIAEAFRLPQNHETLSGLIAILFAKHGVVNPPQEGT